MNNRLIRLVIKATLAFRFLLILTYFLFIGVIIYLKLSPELADSWSLINPFRAGSANFQLTSSTPEGAILIGDLKSWVVFWLISRATAFFIVVFLSFQQALRILKSVADQSTFYSGNVQSFKRLSMLGLIYALLSTFNIGEMDGNTLLNLGIPFLSIMFSLACLVLAEVFREGRKLHEDSNSIV